MSGLLELAARCEAATGPSPILDDHIAREIGVHIPLQDTQGRGIFTNGIPAFTASLDAAMTLVPEGWSFEVMRGWRCDIAEGLSSAFVADKQFGPPTVHEHCDNAATPALALTAAALRARAETINQGSPRKPNKRADGNS